jgi:hypothetical protein
MSRLSRFLDNWLTDDGEIFKPYASASFYPEEDVCYSLLLEA